MIQGQPEPGHSVVCGNEYECFGNRRRREDYAGYYAEVIDLGAFDLPWIRDSKHQHYLWLRHRVRPYAADWPEFKNWY